jgi:DNA polymerase-3 subunit delta'
MAVFLPEIGHPEVQDQILSGLRQNRLPHGYLFHGPEGCGKEAFAIGLAQLLNAEKDNGEIDQNTSQYLKIARLQHPDIKFIFPTPAKTNVKEDEILEALREKAQNPYRQVNFPGKNTFIGIDTIRELKKEAGFKLYEGRKKVFIISEADQMRIEAANALLKLLEEPPQNLVLILITAKIYKILPTIKSRCQLVRFRMLSEEEIKTIVRRYHKPVDESQLPLQIRLSGFNVKRTLEFLEKDILKIREQAIDFLRKVVLIHKTQELAEIIEPLAAQKNREDARLLLWLLLLWFQDILHLQKTSSGGKDLNNFDKEDTLRKFIAYTPNADIPGIAWEIEAAIQDLNDVRNFNPLLILATLAIKLNHQIRKK